MAAHAQQHGPVLYAKGPLYVLSRDLAARLATDAPTLQRATDALATADARHSGGRAGVFWYSETQVWEDVWIGYALSRLSPPPVLGVVSLNGNLYYEEWGFGVTPTTLLWHAKTKDASRPPKLQAYLATAATAHHHCARPPWAPPKCGDGRRSDSRLRGGSCTGGRWLFCLDDGPRRCSHARVNLNNRSSWVEPPPPPPHAPPRPARHRRPG